MTGHAMTDIPCEDVIRSVWDYLDDEIDVEQRERIRRHLQLCDHCRDQYTFEKAFLRSVRRLVDDDTAAISLRARIERALIDHGFSRDA